MFATKVARNPQGHWFGIASLRQSLPANKKVAMTVFTLSVCKSCSESTGLLQKYGGKTVKRLWEYVSRPTVAINRDSRNLGKNEIHYQLNNCLL